LQWLCVCVCEDQQAKGREAADSAVKTVAHCQPELRGRDKRRAGLTCGDARPP
jgi:hypothetical protein